MNGATPEELVSLVAGDLDPATLAARHGVTEGEVLRWCAAFVTGMRAGVGGRALVRRRQFRWVFAAGLGLATVAFAQLTVFSPNAPAIASQVNGNFNQLKTWLEQKVGTVGSANITTTGSVAAASVAATGEVSAGSLSTTGSLSAKAYMPAPANWNAFTLTSSNGAAIINDNVNYKALMVVGNNTANAATRVVKMYDNVEVSGVLYSRGTPVLIDAYTCEGQGCCAGGYQTKSGDLNSGAGGAYIFLCVKYANY